jgi:hypothetical protein
LGIPVRGFSEYFFANNRKLFLIVIIGK